MPTFAYLPCHPFGLFLHIRLPSPAPLPPPPSSLLVICHPMAWLLSNNSNGLTSSPRFITMERLPHSSGHPVCSLKLQYLRQTENKMPYISLVLDKYSLLIKNIYTHNVDSAIEAGQVDDLNLTRLRHECAGKVPSCAPPPTK